jgi:indolepyruvate ferredoxin oxidoreductase beta subunit
VKASITNILLVGVGGQGILLASEILSETFMLAGYDVKKSEIHGMSQRGGSVVSHVRYGGEVFSPIVPEGEGDILFGFELLETCRYSRSPPKRGTRVPQTPLSSALFRGGSTYRRSSG